MTDRLSLQKQLTYAVPSRFTVVLVPIPTAVPNPGGAASGAVVMMATYRTVHASNLHGGSVSPAGCSVE